MLLQLQHALLHRGGLCWRQRLCRSWRPLKGQAALSQQHGGARREWRLEKFSRDGGRGLPRRWGCLRAAGCPGTAGRTLRLVRKRAPEQAAAGRCCRCCCCWGRWPCLLRRGRGLVGWRAIKRCPVLGRRSSAGCRAGCNAVHATSLSTAAGRSHADSQVWGELLQPCHHLGHSMCMSVEPPLTRASATARGGAGCSVALCRTWLMSGRWWGLTTSMSVIRERRAGCRPSGIE